MMESPNFYVGEVTPFVNQETFPDFIHKGSDQQLIKGFQILEQTNKDHLNDVEIIARE